MKTQQLIEMLARNAGPAPQAMILKRLAPAVLLGVMSSSFLAIVVIGLLPLSSFMEPFPWVKLSYAAALAIAAGLLTSRLARPIANLYLPKLLVWLVSVVMALIGATALYLTPTHEQLSQIFGQHWLRCPWTLMGLSLPALAGILIAVRGLAPTQARQAGWASGLLAGALGAMGYALVCPESSLTYIAIWYTLGMIMTALVGRLLGPLVLRW